MRSYNITKSEVLKNASRQHKIERERRKCKTETRGRAFSSTLKNKWLIYSHEQLQDHKHII